MDKIKELANLLGSLIEKYIDKIDLDKLPDTDHINIKTKQ